MALRTLAVILAALALAAPAGSTLSPAAVVRAWSKALNRNDNEAAASLFAPGAVVIQPGYKVVLNLDPPRRWRSFRPMGDVK